VALLEDLQARGLDTSRPTLLVLDGAKALHAAATRVWGKNALIQRCQVHTIRTQSQNGGPRLSFPLSARPRVPSLVSEFV
jgi:Transposase, Mutator family